MIAPKTYRNRRSCRNRHSFLSFLHMVYIRTDSTQSYRKHRPFHMDSSSCSSRVQWYSQDLFACCCLVHQRQPLRPARPAAQRILVSSSWESQLQLCCWLKSARGENMDARAQKDGGNVSHEEFSSKGPVAQKFVKLRQARFLFYKKLYVCIK